MVTTNTEEKMNPVFTRAEAETLLARNVVGEHYPC